MSLQVSNLVKTFGRQRAVDDISFSVAEGSILGFLGPNGAGKSTTMKIATCYLPPTSGSVSVCGYDVASQSIDVRKSVGYLPEHNPLYLDMYVKEYLQFVGSCYGMKQSFINKRIDEMVQLTGLTVEQRKKIGALSKGYRQRVGLASALIHDPKVLILDEPTTGLDPNQIIEIRKLIKEVGRTKTVILSTHIMQEVQAICDRVVIINKGKIVADNHVTQMQQDNSAELEVEFATAIDPKKIIALNPGINLRSIGNNKYSISMPKGVDIRSALFQLSTQEGWQLTELKKVEKSLEDIFRQLTGA
jgi:ABC-2 type transport system ATP-binding protein